MSERATFNQMKADEFRWCRLTREASLIMALA
jgi:hypothetical protein